MRPFRYLLLTVVLAGCPGSDPKSSGDSDTMDTDSTAVDTPDTPDTDTGDTDPLIDTRINPGTADTGDSDSDVDSDPGGDGTGDTGPIDSFVPPNGSGDTGGGIGPTPTPGGPTGLPNPETGDTAISGETGANIDTDACLPGETLDCNGDCYPAALLGDGTCHIGGFGNPDFDCEDLDYDDGDCPTGDTAAPPPVACNGPVDVEDCDGRCYPITWVGDGTCDNGGAGGAANFDCVLYSFDGGDCTSTPDTDTDADTDITLTDTGDSGDDTGVVIDTNDTAN